MTSQAVSASVGDAVSFPFKELQDGDWIKVSLKDKRYYVACVLLCPDRDADEYFFAGHKIYLSIAGNFVNECLDPTSALGQLQVPIRVDLSKIQEISTQTFLFRPYRDVANCSIDYDPKFVRRYRDWEGFPDAKDPIEKIEKVVLKVVKPSVKSAQEQKE